MSGVEQERADSGWSIERLLFKDRGQFPVSASILAQYHPQNDPEALPGLCMCLLQRHLCFIAMV